jgi:hypothetical protein
VSTRTWRAHDYYAALGVAPDASATEIARAFRTLARDLHPDRATHPGDAVRFKQLAAAYTVVGNAERRARYDALRRDGGRAVGAGGGPGPRLVPVDPVTPEPERPLSVRALPSPRAGRLARRGGLAVLAAGIVVSLLILWFTTTTEEPADAARDITFWLIAVKLVVVGAAFAVLGHRRLRHG